MSDDTVEVTPEMIEAGATEFLRLHRAGVGSAYLVEAVFRAMCAARRFKLTPTTG